MSGGQDIDISQLKTECLALAERVESWAVAVLKQLKVERDDPLRVFFTVQTTRSIAFLRSIRELSKSGLVEPAGVLLRVLLEHGFVMVAVRQSPDLLDNLRHQAAQENRKAFGALLKVPSDSRPEWLDDTTINQAIDSIEAP